ncbi:MAG: glycoside hydrolase family 9 protein, partial [Candidatus Hydrogenedentes bacterium]|nr:glycoside hydrolase family 9 protein [Candidatus Hydrogenedentota bacterium]
MLIVVLGIAACSTAWAADAVKENIAAREWAIKIGWLQGIRKVELIRNDLLSVTLDAGITGAIVHPSPQYQDKSKDVMDACGYATDYVKPAAFTITSDSDANYKSETHPADVSMNSLPLKNKVGGGKVNGVDAPGCAWTIFYTPLYQYEYYLFLPKPLKSGASYKIIVNTAKPKAPGVFYNAPFAYDEAKTATKAIKINQVAFSPVAKKRYAYLGWWAAGKGPVDYSSLGKFSVVNEATGAVALTGVITLRDVPEETMVSLTGEKVYEMEISALGPGQYHVAIPGFARSETFVVGGNNVYALYWEAGFPVQGTEIMNHSGSASEIAQEMKNCPPPADMPQKSFIGGIHDAADYDIQCGHMGNINDLMLAYELYPEVLKDGDLDIPESGNGIPDVLDNVEWLLRFFMLNQYPDGAIPASKPNMSDGLTQWREKDPALNVKGYDGLICAGKAPLFGVVPPCDNSTTLFAASAARFSRLVRPFNAAMADRYLASAKKAFEYAISHTPMETYNAYTTERYPLHKPGDKPWSAGSPVNHQCMKGWVAAELMRATGDKAFNRYVVEALDAGRGMWGPNEDIRWAYINLDPA